MYVQIDLDGPAGTLRVSGHGLPTVELVRAPGTAPDAHTPIGTRKPALLALSVDGEAAVIRPARGRLLRRSYRVDVRVEGVRYRLAPCGYVDSRFTRDRRRIGTLTSSGDGRVIDEWDGDPTPHDLALGTALAAAFGTGASPWWETLADVVGELTP
ncbi:hypothetical protein [Streptomyces gardneri]|uniref:Uncharacterized protein n=1 Tax=Streptomyces gardneri TaxID=66892 RepID=A0A4Y3RYH0_9ACTN|nr:hypothetical protein [Streptomyces gardneri]GEB61827.1 hypothetical protein SGA01_74320 [Streptomyces gardneri]GHH07097.1 hypothetical protein GCM10017674_48210 [Streptomyces gardneri]